MGDQTRRRGFDAGVDAGVDAIVDAVVIGAGVVGACCAHYLVEAGLRVAIIDRGSVASGTTGAGEGNILVSDKQPGPELDLALLSRRLWFELIDLIGEDCELEPKGGVVIAHDESTLERLRAFARDQRDAGVESMEVDTTGLRDLEPHIDPAIPGGVHYPQDMQTQPMLAAAHLIARGARTGRLTRLLDTEVIEITRGRSGEVTGVRTTSGAVSAPVVVNAAGTWGGRVAELAGVEVPILPRRGFLLVTEPLPQVVHHKVYAADYVANVASDSEGLQTSAVIEGTRSGTILIGSSRERVGFDATLDWSIVRRLAAQAIAVFPMLASVQLLRTYGGFRPYCPDHLPVIGPDARVPGLIHACGHEGAGVGLAAATGYLIAQSVVGHDVDLSLEPFAPQRFAATADRIGAHG
jgi:D-hydroxyproline dehydrogenase subunit beta